MRAIDRAKVTADNYLAEIENTAQIREAYRDFLVPNAQALFGFYEQDKGTKSRLAAALKLKNTDESTLYRSLVVQVNGVFEQYIRSLVAAVVRTRVESEERYSNFDEHFRNQHAIHAAKVLGHIGSGSVNGQSFNFPNLLDSLGKCFLDRSDFSVNPSVFTILLGNCRPDRIKKIFEILDLPDPFSEQIGVSKALKACLNEPRKAKVGILAEETLGDQLNLRNNIVHGDLSLSVSKLEFEQTLAFYSALIEALTTMVSESMEPA